MSGGAEEANKGLIPRINEELFAQINDRQSSNSNLKVMVVCSFFEIYNEVLFDLLDPNGKTKGGPGLQIKENKVLGVHVQGLLEVVAEDAAKVEKLMEQGHRSRTVGSTKMNAVSSRSHSVFTLKVHQREVVEQEGGEAGGEKGVFAKLNLVDLAGSERASKTGAQGSRLKEGANINKSLSELGNVINGLVQKARGQKRVFIPYRNSKLTRVLQESLGGGNSLCTMLAALSPAAVNWNETLSTLRYASRAKCIKVSASKNEEQGQIDALNEEVADLRKKLKDQQEQLQ
jgi:hypothetical protein